MHKLFVSTCILSFCLYTIYAQEVHIKAIPRPMHFENAPASYKLIGDNTLEIEAPANTDLFYSPDSQYVRNNSPRLLFTPYFCV